VSAYTLYVERPHPKKKGFFRGEWLQPARGSDVDAQEEARALLSDPRDTISHVFVWSNRFNQFVGTYRRQENAYSSN
jgi:hypothetical protein